MAPDEPLDGLKVVSVVLRGDERVLLHDPGDGLVGVAVEDVHLLRPRQRLLPRRSQLAQVLPQLLQLADLMEIKESIN